MGGEICYRKNYEKDPWFEIKCIQEIILGKEKRGEDASFERLLLKSWAIYKGWEAAGKTLP